MLFVTLQGTQIRVSKPQQQNSSSLCRQPFVFRLFGVNENAKSFLSPTFLLAKSPLFLILLRRREGVDLCFVSVTVL
jgi:hypothetical protein